MNGLQRHLGVRAMAALVVGEVIAIGIFLTPATMARSVGSPLWLLVVWLLMGAMALSGALCYVALAARFPEAGGGYVYLREAYGPGVAFLYGWKCLLVMDPGITALLAAALASYVGYALGISGIALKGVAVGSVLILAAVSMLGIRLGARVMQWLMILKVGALALIAVLALALQAGNWSHFVPFIAQRPGSDPLPGALAPACDVGRDVRGAGRRGAVRAGRRPDLRCDRDRRRAGKPLRAADGPAPRVLRDGARRRVLQGHCRRAPPFRHAGPSGRSSGGLRFVARRARHVSTDSGLLHLRDGRVPGADGGGPARPAAPRRGGGVPHPGVPRYAFALPGSGRRLAGAARGPRPAAGRAGRGYRGTRRTSVLARISWKAHSQPEFR